MPVYPAVTDRHEQVLEWVKIMEADPGENSMLVFSDWLEEHGLDSIAQALRDQSGRRSKQPIYYHVGNMGDVNPIEHDGQFVFVDLTGVYGVSMEYLCRDYNGKNWTIYRVDCPKCTYIDGILSDNKFHPKLPAWFAHTEEQRKDRPQDSTYLKNLADQFGESVEELATKFCSDDPMERAFAWGEVFNYHGWDNGDSYPLEGLKRREVEERYKGLIKLDR